MAKDHFVPQHYLRQFRVNGSEFILVANISPYRFIGAKAISGQCQEDGFEEGNKALGKLLWTSENDLAPVLLRVSQKKDFTEPELLGLRWLVATLHLRTKKAAEAYEVFPKRIFLEVIRNAIDSGRLSPPPEGELKEELVDCKGVTGFLLRNVISCALEMQTLACKLLNAQPGTFFITSDNPVLILNQFCDRVETHRGFAGFGRSGFQAILPISSQLCLFFYDPQVYKVGSRRRRLIEVSKTDVEIINALQVQSADKRLLFHEPKLEKEVERLISYNGTLRSPVGDFLRTIPGKNQGDELLYFRAPSVKLPKIWDFCRLRRHIKCVIGERRDPAWSALIEDLYKDFEQNPVPQDIHSRLAKIIADQNSLKNIRRF